MIQKKGFSDKLKTFFFPAEEKTVFDSNRYLKDLDSGLFRDRFVFGVNSSGGGKWDLVDFLEDPHAIFAGATGSGKSFGGAWTVGTYFASNSDQVIMFIMDISKGAGDYSALFKYPNVYKSINQNNPDPLEGCKRIIDMVYSESVARQEAFGGAPNLKAHEIATGKKMPRILIVMEEFHMFPTAIEFEKNVDKLYTTANKLKTLIRVGRSQGIFFILASQKTTQVDVPKHIISNILQKMMFKVTPAESSYVLGNIEASRIKSTEKGRCVSERGVHQFPAFGSLSDGKTAATEFQKNMGDLCDAYYKPLDSECAYMTDAIITDYLNGKDSKDLYKNKKMTELAVTLESINGELALEIIHEELGHKFQKINTKKDLFGICGIVTKENGEDFVIYYDNDGLVSGRTIENIRRSAKERNTLSAIIYTPNDKMSPSNYKFARENGILVFGAKEIKKICELLDNKSAKLANLLFEVPRGDQYDDGYEDGASGEERKPKTKTKILYLEDMARKSDKKEYIKSMMENIPKFKKDNKKELYEEYYEDDDGNNDEPKNKEATPAKTNDNNPSPKVQFDTAFVNADQLEVYKKYKTTFVDDSQIDGITKTKPKTS